MSTVEIISTASYLPPTIVTNDDMRQFVDTSDEWIKTRTGIERRRFAKEETNAQMASKAAKLAIEKSGIPPTDICCCIVATFSPDNFTPSTACEVQKQLNLPENIMAFDINAACSGFVYGLQIVHGLLMQQPHKYALLIGSEKLTDYLDFEDRATCVLFGDGAGAVVVGLREDSHHFSVYGACGDIHALCCKARPALHSTKPPTITMDGSKVFKFAADVIPKCIDQLLEQSQMTIEEIDYIVCHQANMRIISHVYKKMKIPPEKFFVNLQDYGNTSAASIPIALDEMHNKGMLKKGNKIICVGFGSGLTWGAVLMTW
ncbi:MAG: beta-ketoacyl-ACP synthase III [Angelakisella sp.]